MKKIKEVKQFVESGGVDVSKLTLDVFIYNKSNTSNLLILKKDL